MAFNIFGWFATKPKTANVETLSLRKYYSEYERGEEIEAWLSKSQATNWAALNDDVEGFTPRLRAKLVLVDGKVGLQAQDAVRLRVLMAQPGSVALSAQT